MIAGVTRGYQGRKEPLITAVRCSASLLAVLPMPSPRDRAGRLMFEMRSRASPSPDHPVCRRPARQGCGPGASGQDGAPCRTNDLDHWRLVCSACPGSTADGMSHHPNHLPTPGYRDDHPGAGAPRRRRLRLVASRWPSSATYCHLTRHPVRW